MSTDTHFKFEGVEGESLHKEHKGEVEAMSWSWSAHNASATAGQGSGKGKGEGGHFTLMHVYDKASPVLAKHCISGKHFPTVVMTSRKSGDGQKDFLKVTMKEVFITAVQPSGSHGGDIHEQVTMSYKQVEFAYKAQDEKGGMGGEVKFGWNSSTTEVT